MAYNYTVIKSDRKTYSIRITDDNEIIVRAPEKASKKDIDKLLESKKGWIEKVLAFNNENRLDTPEVRSGKVAYVNGYPVPVVIGGKNGVDAEGVHITNSRDFKAAYVKGLGDAFLAMFAEVENRCKLRAKSVSFRSYKSRWGCCDGDNNIIFNFKLMMLPSELQYYVMVHELCHTVWHNHSTKFWTLVKKFLPDCMKLRKQLKNYNFLVNMY